MTKQKLGAKYAKAYKYLWRSYGRNRLYQVSFVLQIIKNISKFIALPIIAAQIISLLSQGDYESAKRSAVVFVLFSALIGISAPLVKYIGMIGENVVYGTTTADYFKKLVTTDIEYFNSNLAGYLTTATRQFVDSGILLARNMRDSYAQTMMAIIFPVIVIAWANWQIGIVVLILSVMQAGYMVWSSKKVDPYRSNSRELLKKNTGFMADNISNILAVKATSQEKNVVDRVATGAKREMAVFKVRYTVRAKLAAGREVVTVTFYSVVLLLAIYQMQIGTIQLAYAVLIITYINPVLTAIYLLSDQLDEHDDLVDKLLPAFEIFERNNKVNDPEEPIQLVNPRGEVAFNAVSFAYEEDGSKQVVLKDFSLRIPEGQKIGVVGVSGAGKSTLTKLLLRLNDVESGSVSIDGVDIRQLAQADARRLIAYVPQEPFLFHETIRKNIVFSKPDATEEELEHALKVSHAKTFVDALPSGVDSVVGERGVKLSGGQKQRVAIARAVLQNAPIMVLDEATSALDSESEQIIKSSFKDILKKKTAIVVAHRLSTLSDMDRIILIDGGVIVEDGTHETLLEKNGVYAKLWRYQQRLDESA